MDQGWQEQENQEKPQQQDTSEPVETNAASAEDEIRKETAAPIDEAEEPLSTVSSDESAKTPENTPTESESPDDSDNNAEQEIVGEEDEKFEEPPVDESLPVSSEEEPCQDEPDNLSSEEETAPAEDALEEDNPDESAELKEFKKKEENEENDEQDLSKGEGEAAENDQETSSAGVTRDQIVEALLFSTEGPISASKIANVVGAVSPQEVRDIISNLNQKYRELNRSFQIEQIAGGYQMMTRPEYGDYLQQLFKIRSENKLSAAALETLAVISYKQPVLRAEVEAVRGVSCGEMIRALMEKDLIKIVGRAEELGRPMLYGTTKRFLEVFGLGSLEDLPKVPELLPTTKHVQINENATEKNEKKDADSTSTETTPIKPEQAPELPSPETAPAADVTSAEETAPEVEQTSPVDDTPAAEESSAGVENSSADDSASAEEPDSDQAGE